MTTVASDSALLAEFMLEVEEALGAADTILDAMVQRAASPEDVRALFRLFHRIKGGAGLVGRTEVGTSAHAVESLLDRARRGAALEVDEVRAGVATIRRLLGSAPASPSADADASVPAMAVQPTTKPMTKIEMSRIDDVVEILGELLIAQAQVTGAPEVAALQSPELAKSMMRLARINRELQRSVLRMRTVPLRALFDRLGRAAADLARRTGKELAFVQEGGATEIDRSMLETLEPALLHLLRNAVDHGIEHAGQRIATGKPSVGRITVAARQDGSSIVVTIADDGRGFAREGILARARAIGALDGDVAPRNSKIDELVFLPGLSTADCVTDISGRGVGMDVVLREVSLLRGRMHVTSIAGSGTTIAIALPLTLALLDVVMVSRAGTRWAIPAPSIVEVATGADVVPVHTPTQRGAKVRGEWLPLVRLGEEDPVATTSSVVVLRGGRARVALPIDEVVAQQQVIVKGLPRHVAIDPRVSAAAVLPDGSLVLVIDVEAVARQAS